jgi:hypothetical protein
MREPSEGKTCDALLRYLEERDGDQRTDVRWPEAEGHPAPIDLVCMIGHRLYAVEHTIVEPFPGHLEASERARRYFPRIQSAIAGDVPQDELWELYIPTTALQGRRGSEVRRIQDALIVFIRQTTPTLPKRPFGRPQPASRFNVPNVPFAVGLHRLVTAGRFQFGLIHRDAKRTREERVRQACDAKFGKLAAWKADGARTVLLLENPDLQLTNPMMVADAFLPIAIPRADRPDETYLIDSCTTTLWLLWPLLVGGESFFDLGVDRQPLLMEFDPGTLAWVTQPR